MAFVPNPPGPKRAGLAQGRSYGRKRVGVRPSQGHGCPFRRNGDWLWQAISILIACTRREVQNKSGWNGLQPDLPALRALQRRNRAAQHSRKGQSWRSPPSNSIRRGLARDIVPAPGRRSKCANSRRRNAGTAVSILGSRFGFLHDVPRRRHSGGCEHGCSNQRSRQNVKLGHSISPLDVKSQHSVSSTMEMAQRSAD